MRASLALLVLCVVAAAAVTIAATNEPRTTVSTDVQSNPDGTVTITSTTTVVSTTTVQPKAVQAAQAAPANTPNQLTEEVNESRNIPDGAADEAQPIQLAPVAPPAASLLSVDEAALGQAAPVYTYSQRTGVLTYPNGRRVQGYAGKGTHRNNPASQCRASQGPLPRGRYSISRRTKNGAAADSLAAPVFRLTPMSGTNMCRRSGMLIHGGVFAPSYSSSEGCIILSTNDRKDIQIGGILNVV